MVVCSIQFFLPLVLKYNKAVYYPAAFRANITINNSRQCSACRVSSVGVGNKQTVNIAIGTCINCRYIRTNFIFYTLNFQNAFPSANRKKNQLKKQGIYLNYLVQATLNKFIINRVVLIITGRKLLCMIEKPRLIFKKMYYG